METIKTKILEEFTDVANTLVNPEMKKWREQGGKMIGYYCCYAPEEIITAAGFLPYRIRATGSKGTELSDAHMSSINCSFCRHSMNLALGGEYDFLDGVVWLNTCDHLRRTYDIWTRKVETPFTHMLSFPRTQGEAQVQWFREELDQYRQSLGKQFGIQVSDERLRDAIKLHNETRRLQRKLYELRKREKPLLTGSEMLAVTVAGTAMPKARYNAMLKELVEEISKREGIGGYRARLMLVGSIVDDPAYVKIIEDLGGLVVTDSLCYGSRNLWSDVSEEGDPLTALARYHVMERPSCPRIFGCFPKMVEFLNAMIRDFKVDGVISERMQFCDLWGMANYQLTKEFAETKVPLLVMEREYLLGGIGQLRTRVQAFLETIEKGGD